MSEATAFPSVEHALPTETEAPRIVPQFRSRASATAAVEASDATSSHAELGRLAAAIVSLADRQGSLILHFCGTDGPPATQSFHRLARQITQAHHARVLCLSAGLPSWPDRPTRAAMGGHPVSEMTVGGFSIRHDGEIYHASLADGPDDAPRLQQVRELYAALKERFPLILVNAAPALVAPAITNLAVLADAVVLTVQADVTSLSAIRRTKATLTDLGVPLLGAIYGRKRRLLPAMLERLLPA